MTSEEISDTTILTHCYSFWLLSAASLQSCCLQHGCCSNPSCIIFT